MRDGEEVKIVFTGPIGAGKTTAIAAISDAPPVSTDVFNADRQSADKDTTTAALDFGQIVLDDGLVVRLYGTPGQDRFGFMWDDLVVGALGAIVLVDLRRIDDCFPAIDFFESRQVPFIVAINRFEGEESPDLAEVREALDLDETHPIVVCDARYRESVKSVVLALLDMLISAFRKRQVRAGGGRRGL